ncbi:MAG TPA: hypothetical protein VFT72_20875 [Opitutaceae bacterium]|nr:hypothetical protein [Opitutaceae bacterium]
MKALLSYCVLAACLTIGVKADSASSTEKKSSGVSVEASADLRIAVLDTSRSGLDKDAIHEAFATSFAATMSKQCGGTVNVKLTDVDAFRIAFELKNGMYDAVLVVGNVPAPLRRDEYEILRAVSEASAPAKVFHLVIPGEDPSLRRMLAASFPDALSNVKFQDAIAHAVAIKVNPDIIRQAAKEAVADSTR